MLFKDKDWCTNNTRNIVFFFFGNIFHTFPLLYGLRISCCFTFISYDSVIKISLSYDCTIFSPLIIVSQDLGQGLTHGLSKYSLSEWTIAVVFYST